MLQENRSSIVWFQGPQLPDSLISEEGNVTEDVTEDPDNDLIQSSDNEEEDFNSDDILSVRQDVASLYPSTDTIFTNAALRLGSVKRSMSSPEIKM